MAASSTTIGSRIRQARHSAGLTQAALAQAAQTRERNIIRWENDQHEPRFEHVAAIAKATSKDIAFFTEGLAPDDDEEPDPLVALMAALRKVVREEVAARDGEQVKA